MVTVQYFGVLQDKIGAQEEDLPWQNGGTQELLMLLRSRNDIWADALQEENIFRLVVNDEIIYDERALKSGDKIAILPPVTGG